MVAVISILITCRTPSDNINYIHNLDLIFAFFFPKRFVKCIVEPLRLLMKGDTHEAASISSVTGIHYLLWAQPRAKCKILLRCCNNIVHSLLKF